jgi:hypothetical protein
MYLYLNSKGQLPPEDGVSLTGETSDRTSPNILQGQERPTWHLSASSDVSQYVLLYALIISFHVLHLSLDAWGPCIHNHLLP